MKIEYRTPPGTGSYAALADEGDTSPGSLQERIKGYQPALRKEPQRNGLAFALVPFVQDRGNGLWSISFSVDRVHATPDAALLFIVTHTAVFNVAANFDLKITVGAQVVYLANGVLAELVPEPHSDQSTVCKYGFVGGSYQTTPP